MSVVRCFSSSLVRWFIDTSSNDHKVAVDAVRLTAHARDAFNQHGGARLGSDSSIER